MITEETNWNYLVEEVRHWIEVADDPYIAAALEENNIKEVGDLVSSAIENHHSIEEFGYQEDSLEEFTKFYQDVDWIVTEGLNRGWDYVYI